MTLEKPSRAVALSLAALVLVAGSLGIVAVLDQDASYGYEAEIDKNLSVSKWTYYNGAWAPTNNTVNMLTPDQTGAGYLFDASSAVSQVTEKNLMQIRMTFDKIDGKFLHEGVKSVIVETTSPATLVRFQVFDATTNVIFVMESVAPGLWVYEFSTTDILRLNGMTITQECLLFNFVGTDFISMGGYVEFNMSFYETSLPIYYASLLIGALGIVLIISAIYATDVVDVGTVGRMARSTSNKLKAKNNARKAKKKSGGSRS